MELKARLITSRQDQGYAIRKSRSLENNQEKIRAFSLQSDFDDNESIFSRDFNKAEETSSKREDVAFFRSNSNLDENRLNTPGFMVKCSKQPNSKDRNGTTETRYTTTNTVSSISRPESRLRFKRVNIVNQFKLNDKTS